MTAQAPSPASPNRPETKDEPEIAFEESIPSDGKDTVGERMIDDLGRDKPKNDPPKSPGEPMPEQLPVS